MARLPDLVRDSRLDVEFRDGCSVHVYLESSLTSRQRAVRREESWKQEKQIGCGAFGSVWLERCISGTQEGAVRAVKKITVRQTDVGAAVYLRELEAITKFSHPKYVRCFVQSFGWYESHEGLTIAMEYCEQGDLRGYLARRPTLPETQAQEIIFQVLEGVRFMHENEFAHRDLKPGNILIKSQPPDPWWIKITDFGISKRMEESLDIPSTVKGTPQFMAPELRGFTSVHTNDSDPASPDLYAADMWSLGEIAFQLLTGQPTFPRLPQLILYVQDSLPFPSTILAQHSVSGSGQSFVSAVMHRSPDSRLTASTAWGHEWMEQYQSSFEKSNSETPESSNAAPYTKSSVNSLTGEFATWNSGLGYDRGTHPSIPPFMNNNESQKHSLPTLQLSDGSKISANVEITPTFSQDTQPQTLTPTSRPEEEHSCDSQEKAQPSPDKDTRESMQESRLLHVLKADPAEGGGIFFSQDSKQLALISHECIRIWDANSEVLSLRISGDHPGEITSVAFSPDGKTFASGSADSSFKFWDLSTGSLLDVIHNPKSKGWAIRRGARGAVFSPTGEHFAYRFENDIRIWDTNSRILLCTLRTRKTLGSPSPVRTMALSPESKRLASVSEDNVITMWDIPSGKRVYWFKVKSHPVTTVIFLLDGSRLVTVSAEDVQIWQSTDGQLLHKIKAHGCESILSRDGQYLAIIKRQHAVTLYDTNSGNLLYNLEGRASAVRQLQFSSDGKLAYSSFDNTIRLLDIKSRTSLLTLEVPIGYFRHFAFSPDGKQLALVSKNGTIKIWDTNFEV